MRPDQPFRRSAGIRHRFDAGRKILELASKYDRTGRTTSVRRRHRVGRGADRRLDPGRDLAGAAARPPAGGRGTGPAGRGERGDRQLPPGQTARGRHDHRHQAGQAPLLPAGRARGRGGPRGARPDQPGLPVRSLRQSREAVALAEARTCYDHLAGRAGVELLDGLLRRGLLEEKSGRTDRADTSSASLRSHRGRSEGTRLVRPESPPVRRSRRRFAGTCIDWTQRRRHLNGALAAAITSRLFELGWIERGSPGQRRRSVRVTPAGIEGLASTFGVASGGRLGQLGGRHQK